MHTVGFGLFHGLVHHSVVKLLEVLVGLFKALYQVVLLFPGHAVPGLGADNVDVRGVLVLCICIGLHQILMAVHGKGQLRILRSVHNSLLQ